MRSTIFDHPEITAFTAAVRERFDTWRATATAQLTRFHKDGHPKQLIETIAENLLESFKSAPLLDAYDVYQHLMGYWAETMQDDCYLISAEGWVARPTRIVEVDKKGRRKEKGWTCELVPKPLIVARYFAGEQAALDAKQAELGAATASLAELEEEHGGEEGFLGSLDKVARAEVNARRREVEDDAEASEERVVLDRWLGFAENEATLKRAVPRD